MSRHPERNFCERCGKRVSPDGIHTCTPPHKPEQEPVAWQWLDTGHFRKKIPAYSTPAHWRPLYTTPPARQPLTTDQIVVLWNEAITNGAVLGLSDTVLFARAIERAHNITGGNDE